jgi:hypothetical protein
MRARSSTNAEMPREAGAAWGPLSFRQKLRLFALASVFLVSWAVMVFGTGCSLIVRQGPSDLRFVQVALANSGGTTGGQSAQRRPKVLVVTLATEHDLSADFEKTGAYPRVDARTCSRDSTPVRIFAQLPRFGELDPYEYAPQVRQADDVVRATASKLTYFYHVSFDDKSDRAFDEFTVYDLRKDPQGVCITIGGNPYLGIGVGVSTNKVVVPRDAIAAALRAAQP